MHIPLALCYDGRSAFNGCIRRWGYIKYKDSEPKPSAEHRMGRNFSPDGGAPTAIASLLQEAEKAGVKVMLETPAKELIEDKGVVKGVIAKGKDGTTYEISSKAVILSTGGYGANRDLLLTCSSLPYAGAVSATGDVAYGTKNRG